MYVLGLYEVRKGVEDRVGYLTVDGRPFSSYIVAAEFMMALGNFRAGGSGVYWSYDKSMCIKIERFKDDMQEVEKPALQGLNA